MFSNAKLAGMPHVFTSNGFLHFASTQGEYYIGVDTVRDVTVDHWRSCMTWPQIPANFTLDYYFTATNWTSPSGYTVPVRAEVTGISNGRNFHHIYDYFDFQPNIVFRDEDFETPPGVVCHGQMYNKPLPTIPNNFYYREEMVVGGQYYETADIWYDGARQLVRLDRTTPFQTSRVQTLHPTTEIYDFNRGIEYIIDKVLGNCTAFPINNQTFAARENMTIFRQNNSYVLGMRSPTRFLDLDSSFQYTGQRDARGIRCNVFSSTRNDFPVPNNGPHFAILEYYFAADQLSEFPGGPLIEHDVPILLNLQIPDMNIKTTYNFVEFHSQEAPDISAFDVSMCYSDSQKLQFTVQFQGTYQPNVYERLVIASHKALTETMSVVPLRIQNLYLTPGPSSFHVTTTLLDISPPEVQFTLVGGPPILGPLDSIKLGATTGADCARSCLSEFNSCKSFDFCILLSGSTSCLHSSSRNISETLPNYVGATCSRYVRTVMGRPIETSMLTAYNALTFEIYSGQFRFYLPQLGTFTAEAVSLAYGWLQKTTAPILPGQFSSRIEQTNPGERSIFESQIKYDATHKLVLYDAISYDYPYHQTFTIHDFNTGIAYKIDEDIGSCSISHIPVNGFDATRNPKTNGGRGAYLHNVENAAELLGMNMRFQYVGQSTKRGLLCDVFEGQWNLSIPGVTMATLRYYFLHNTWTQLSTSGNDETTRQPVSLDISSAQMDFFTTYNFLDFVDGPFNLNHFDIQKCFPDKQKHIKIDLQGPNNSAANGVFTRRVDFSHEFLNMLVVNTRASPLRFQNIEVTIYLNRIYVLFTIVGKAPAAKHFVRVNSTSDEYDERYSNVASLEDCAQQCQDQISTQCWSFAYCDTQQLCMLKGHKSNSQSPSNCKHFLRTVATSYVEPSLGDLVKKLVNLIAKKKLTIDFFVTDRTVATFTVTRITQDISRVGRQSEATSNFKHFSIRRNAALVGHNEGVRAPVSVDECARECLNSQTFFCQSFDYCYSWGECQFSVSHPEDIPQDVNNDVKFCDMYSRNYVDNFRAVEGLVPVGWTGLTLYNVNTLNMCAQRCLNAVNSTCRAFNFCNSTLTCELMTSHYTYANANTTQATCSHYSREYSDDFTMIENRTMTTGIITSISNTNAHACAQTCIKEDSKLCWAFSSCVGIFPQKYGAYSARIMAGTPCKGGAGSSLMSRQCSTDGSSNYGPGAMAGLGVSMLVVGTFIGVGILYYGHGKFTKRYAGASTFTR
ncbi:hypothetical protein ScPMuIL_000609 [Solemya velum]